MFAALRPKKPGYFGGDIYGTAKQATQKTLPGPDAELNAEVREGLVWGRWRGGGSPSFVRRWPTAPAGARVRRPAGARGAMPLLRHAAAQRVVYAEC